jgi:hypothetical protein
MGGKIIFVGVFRFELRQLIPLTESIGSTEGHHPIHGLPRNGYWAISDAVICNGDEGDNFASDVEQLLGLTASATACQGALALFAEIAPVGPVVTGPMYPSVEASVEMLAGRLHPVE